VLVAKLLSDSSEFALTGYGQYRSSGSAPRAPEGHFIVLPSTDCSLLVKSLAVSELMMPAEFPPADQHSQQYLDNMATVLDKVSQ